ncbi:MAG: (deoxy)nucleoside triphosphate pyrophosphohydrolase [Gammaproteobacteria bacterium]|nr:(deoxy)nucleoside triphosphate pyrophosphohydrolase [Gammaproteobacteria bacterium]
MALPRVRVVAAALFDAAGRVLIAQRPAGKAMAGRWEFPGGKVAAGEGELAALTRELAEELGIELGRADHALALAHDYPDFTVELSLWIIESYRGTPRPLDGQRLKWVPAGALPAEDLLEADRPFVELLAARAAPA